MGTQLSLDLLFSEEVWISEGTKIFQLEQKTTTNETRPESVK